MIIEHQGASPSIHHSAYIAPNAVICGDVTVGKGSRIMFGAQIIAESAPITIGDNCIILENAVIRGTQDLPVSIGYDCLIGPQTHLAGCTLGDAVFIATGSSIFHGAVIGSGTEVRVNGIVHLKSKLPENAVVPIGWIAVGSPAELFPPDQHDAIWAKQKELNFPKVVYGINERTALANVNKKLTAVMSERLASHFDDRTIS